jgi:hypothetical protein
MNHCGLLNRCAHLRILNICHLRRWCFHQCSAAGELVYMCGEAGKPLTLAHLRHWDVQRASIFTAQNCSHWIIGEHATVSPMWLSFHILLTIPHSLLSCGKQKYKRLFTEQIEILRVCARTSLMCDRTFTAALRLHFLWYNYAHAN